MSLADELAACQLVEEFAFQIRVELPVEVSQRLEVAEAGRLQGGSDFVTGAMEKLVLQEKLEKIAVFEAVAARFAQPQVKLDAGPRHAQIFELFTKAVYAHGKMSL